MDDIFERIEQIATLDLNRRGVAGPLLAAARERAGGSVYRRAAEALAARVRPGDVVMVISGWHDRQTVNSRIAETDGPPGAVALARCLAEGLRVTPIILTDQNLVEDYERLLMTAGLRPMRAEEAKAGLRTERAPLYGGVVMGFPRQPAQAEERARELIGAHRPSALISIEVGGMTEGGRVLTFRGDGATQAAPKFDALFREGKDAVTVGIGDGGNELGFGAIRDSARRALAGEAGPERAPATEADHILPAAVSNWGAYALLAALAVTAGESRLIHPSAREQKLLARARDLGFIDGMSGFVSETVDGLSHDVQLAIANLLETIALSGLGDRRA